MPDADFRPEDNAMTVDARTAEPAATPAEAGARSDAVRVVPKHHALVRLTHWANVPLLLGLIASGMSIYWAAPVFLHRPNPLTHDRDYFVDLGRAIANALHEGGDPRFWIYEHF